jgi:hypothetical protein
MTKRLVAAGLWFYAAWYCGNILAEFAPVSPLIGPIFGAVFVALILAKPARALWANRSIDGVADGMSATDALTSVASSASSDPDSARNST